MCFCSSTLDTLNLPSALDALDQPIGLPPSLLKKAEEVRLEKGPDRIETTINDVQALAARNATLLDEVMLLGVNSRPSNVSF